MYSASSENSEIYYLTRTPDNIATSCQRECDSINKHKNKYRIETTVEMPFQFVARSVFCSKIRYTTRYAVQNATYNNAITFDAEMMLWNN